MAQSLFNKGADHINWGQITEGEKRGQWVVELSHEDLIKLKPKNIKTFIKEARAVTPAGRASFIKPPDSSTGRPGGAVNHIISGPAGTDGVRPGPIPAKPSAPGVNLKESFARIKEEQDAVNARVAEIAREEESAREVSLRERAWSAENLDRKGNGKPPVERDNPAVQERMKQIAREEASAREVSLRERAWSAENLDRKGNGKPPVERDDPAVQDRMKQIASEEKSAREVRIREKVIRELDSAGAPGGGRTGGTSHLNNADKPPPRPATPTKPAAPPSEEWKVAVENYRKKLEAAGKKPLSQKEFLSNNVSLEDLKGLSAKLDDQILKGLNKLANHEGAGASTPTRASAGPAGEPTTGPTTQPTTTPRPTAPESGVAALTRAAAMTADQAEALAREAGHLTTEQLEGLLDAGLAEERAMLIAGKAGQLTELQLANLARAEASGIKGLAGLGNALKPLLKPAGVAALAVLPAKGALDALYKAQHDAEKEGKPLETGQQVSAAGIGAVKGALEMVNPFGDGDEGATGQNPGNTFDRVLDRLDQGTGRAAKAGLAATTAEVFIPGAQPAILPTMLATGGHMLLNLGVNTLKAGAEVIGVAAKGHDPGYVYNGIAGAGNLSAAIGEWGGTSWNGGQAIGPDGIRGSLTPEQVAKLSNESMQHGPASLLKNDEFDKLNAYIRKHKIDGGLHLDPSSNDLQIQVAKAREDMKKKIKDLKAGKSSISYFNGAIDAKIEAINEVQRELISFSEVVTRNRDIQQAKQQAQFKTFDKNGDGMIDANERHAIRMAELDAIAKISPKGASADDRNYSKIARELHALGVIVDNAGGSVVIAEVPKNTPTVKAPKAPKEK